MTTRITLADTPKTIAQKMGDGNMGGARVVADLLEQGHVLQVLRLDSYGIYGHRIWMLYKDVCREKLDCMVAALGEVDQAKLDVAIDNRGKGMEEWLRARV